MLWIVPLLMVLCLCPVGCCGGLFWWGASTLKTSTPFQMAMDQLRQDPTVAARLGAPIEAASWIPSGNVQIENDTGNSTFDFRIAGPQGVADVHSDARMQGGVWRIESLSVVYEDGERQAIVGP